MKIITVEACYALAGLYLLVLAGRIAGESEHPRRWGSSLFWALLGVTLIGAKLLPPTLIGYLVVAMVALAASGQVRRGAINEASRDERLGHAKRLENRIFWPALLIPATAVLGTLVLGQLHFRDVWLVEPKQVTLIALSLGATLALTVALRTTGATVNIASREGSRLLQTLGWSLILPQMLAALGGIFAKAGVGEVVAGLVTQAVPTEVPWVAVVSYCGGMTLFTMVMGNAFAAFAVITGGIGLPFVVLLHGGNPAIMAAMGMLSGYCGTLLTPMAANFNLVPAMLLELDDKHAVIKAQAPLALVIFAANMILMMVLVYRF
ncbi:MAG: DUF979 domain-containing protein [Opitutaceae bacterium]